MVIDDHHGRDGHPGRFPIRCKGSEKRGGKFLDICLQKGGGVSACHKAFLDKKRQVSFGPRTLCYAIFCIFLKLKMEMSPIKEGDDTFLDVKLALPKQSFVAG